MITILEKGDFVRNRKNDKIYWIIDIDYQNKMYLLEYIVKAGSGFEDDEKRTIGFSFDEVRNNFDEEKHKGVV